MRAFVRPFIRPLILQRFVDSAIRRRFSPPVEWAVGRLVYVRAPWPIRPASSGGAERADIKPGDALLGIAGFSGSMAPPT